MKQSSSNKKFNFSNIMKKDFKVVENGKYFAIPPIAILLIAIIVFAILGFNLGIDFTGGTIMQVKFGTGLTTQEYNANKAEIESILNKNNVTKFSLQKEGDSKETSISIKFQDINGKTETEMQEVISAIKEQLTETINADSVYENFSVEDSERIGATASNSLILNAVLSVVIATILMLIYIGIRFELASGLSAIIALLHDVIMMISLTVIFQIQVNSSFIAALITIIGYSINNTIVLFDRIRENLRKEDLSNATNSQIVNLSIKETFIRNLNTALTTIISVILLAIIGVSTIREFIIPILFGLFAGTYSSFFIAGTIWAKIYNKKKDLKLKKKLEQKNENKKDDDKIAV